MKLIVFIVCVALLSVAVLARDLSSLAKKERVRRQNIDSPPARTFTNDDLDVYGDQALVEPAARKPTRALAPSRNLKQEESYWREQSLRHQRELARLDAGIRRLEGRLRARQTNSRAKGRLREDTALALMEESLESLRDERAQLRTEFMERARKAGAFPGWLR